MLLAGSSALAVVHVFGRGICRLAYASHPEHVQHRVAFLLSNTLKSLDMVFEGLLASWISNRFGRRVTMILGGFAFMLGSIMQAIANEIVLLVCGRVILGFAIGLANQVCKSLQRLQPTLPTKELPHPLIAA